MSAQKGTLAPDAVRQMFDRISPIYDLMNRAMTAGLDGKWRRLTADAVVRPGARVLDACCGTGDLALAAERAGGRVTGVDFAEGMLDRARRKSDAVEWVQGDVMALPFEDASFDVVTVGFGIRNVEDLETALAELARVLKPGGSLACLEITRPRGALAPFFGLWFDRLVPLAGKLLPGGAAYAYLPASVRRFPGPEELAEAMRRAGFEDVRYRLLAGGIVALHVGTRRTANSDQETDGDSAEIVSFGRAFAREARNSPFGEFRSGRMMETTSTVSFGRAFAREARKRSW